MPESNTNPPVEMTPQQRETWNVQLNIIGFAIIALSCKSIFDHLFVMVPIVSDGPMRQIFRLLSEVSLILVALYGVISGAFARTEHLKHQTPWMYQTCRAYDLSWVFLFVNFGLLIWRFLAGKL